MGVIENTREPGRGLTFLWKLRIWPLIFKGVAATAFRIVCRGIEFLLSRLSSHAEKKEDAEGRGGVSARGEF